MEVLYIVYWSDINTSMWHRVTSTNIYKIFFTSRINIYFTIFFDDLSKIRHWEIQYNVINHMLPIEDICAPHPLKCES